MVGKRVGFGREAMPPHSLTMTLIGAALLWVGWFGFNAGSALEANGTAALAMINTFVATAAAALAWMLAEKDRQGQAAACSAAPRAPSPASSRSRRRRGFAGPMGAIVLGIVAGFVCLFFCSAIKNALGYDDALDVFGVHCIGGIIGAIGTASWSAPLGRHRRVRLHRAGKVGDYDMVAQVITQAKTVGLTLVWSGSARRSCSVVRSSWVCGRHRPGARGPRPRRSRRARLQLLRYEFAARSRAPSDPRPLSRARHFPGTCSLPGESFGRFFLPSNGDDDFTGAAAQPREQAQQIAPAARCSPRSAHIRLSPRA